MWHARRNMHACARRSREPVAVNVEIHHAVEDIKCLGVLAMQVQTKCKFALRLSSIKAYAPPVSAAATLTKV